MKTSMTTKHSLAMALMLSAGTAFGLGGTAFGDEVENSGVEILEQMEDSCPQRGGLCVAAGAPSTQVVTAAGGHGASTTRFSRVGTSNRKGNVDDSVPWTLTVNATLKQPALKGNAQFFIFDMEDPRALADKQVTAMWQTRVHAGNQLSARLTLSPEDGFHADHTYRVRVCQILNHREVTLAEGDVRLTQ